MREFIIQRSRPQCILALVSAAVVAVCVCVGVTMNLVTIYDENFDHMGIRTFCMFTVNSNILAGSSIMLCLPYTIDGLRTGQYHLPNWIVILMFAAVTGVALTFLVSLCLLAPVKGFELIFTGSRFFLHAVCPILSILAFCFFICDHRITVWETFWALIPVFIYAVVYFVMVVVIGPERGGWEDFYGFATRIPVWISMVSIMPLTFVIATLLRLVHNFSCMRRRKKGIEFFQKICGTSDLRPIIDRMACAGKRLHGHGDIRIPARAIRYMIEDTGSEMTLEEGCRWYLETFLTEAAQPGPFPPRPEAPAPLSQQE